MGLVAVAVIGAAAWAWLGREPAGTSVERGAVRVEARFRSTVTASGEIVATRYADIGSDVMGRIVSLEVTEGQRVSSGQVLARLDAVQARADASSAEAQVSALMADERAAMEQGRAAGHEVEAAAARSREADQQLARTRELRAQGLVAAAALEAAEASAGAAGAALASARASETRAREAAAAAGRRIDQARAQRARVADVLRKTSVVSPIDGIISRLRVRQGEMVVVGLQNQPGTTLMTVSDLSEVNAEVKVAEAEVLQLKVGQPAEVSLEALAGRRFPGRVLEIGASALPVTGTTAAAREFRVVVRLEGPVDTLRPGLTCDAEILTSETPEALVVPLQAVVLRTDANGTERSGVFVIRDDRVTFVPVTTGAIGGVDVAIQGVPAGTPLVTGPFQALRDLKDGDRISTN